MKAGEYIRQFLRPRTLVNGHLRGKCALTVAQALFQTPFGVQAVSILPAFSVERWVAVRDKAQEDAAALDAAARVLQDGELPPFARFPRGPRSMWAERTALPLRFL